jgi:acyl-CoA thioesterase FadM
VKSYSCGVNLIFRTIIHLILSHRAPRIDPHGVGSIRLRVLPTDIDVLGHMNNGVYPSLMDLGRIDVMIRSGVWKKMRAHGFYPVMANETITFRKSLPLWQRFEIESRIVGYDHKAVYVEQRFVVKDEIFAQGMTRARFLKKGGDVVSMRDLSELLGIDVSSPTPPAWIADWNDAVLLPGTKAAAPSIWV